MITKSEMYGYDVEDGQPDPLAVLRIPVWIGKGSQVSNVSYGSPFFGFGTAAYDQRAYYVFVKELRRACHLL